MLKTISLVIFIGFAIAVTGQNGKQQLSKEEQAIVSTINQETVGWWQRDYKKWADSWAHEDYINWSGTTNVVHRYFKGWPSVDQYAKECFKKFPEPNENPVVRTNWTFRIYKNGAWVHFTQESDGISQETRILEKKAGKWKLVHIGWINETSYEKTASRSDEDSN